MCAEHLECLAFARRKHRSTAVLACSVGVGGAFGHHSEKREPEDALEILRLFEAPIKSINEEGDPNADDEPEDYAEQRVSDGSRRGRRSWWRGTFNELCVPGLQRRKDAEGLAALRQRLALASGPLLRGEFGDLALNEPSGVEDLLLIDLLPLLDELLGEGVGDLCGLPRIGCRGRDRGDISCPFRGDFNASENLRGSQLVTEKARGAIGDATERDKPYVRRRVSLRISWDHCRDTSSLLVEPRVAEQQLRRRRVLLGLQRRECEGRSADDKGAANDQEEARPQDRERGLEVQRFALVGHSVVSWMVRTVRRDRPAVSSWLAPGSRSPVSRSRSSKSLASPWVAPSHSDDDRWWCVRGTRPLRPGAPRHLMIPDCKRFLSGRSAPDRPARAGAGNVSGRTAPDSSRSRYEPVGLLCPVFPLALGICRRNRSEAAVQAPTPQLPSAQSQPCRALARVPIANSLLESRCRQTGSGMQWQQAWGARR